MSAQVAPAATLKTIKALIAHAEIGEDRDWWADNALKESSAAMRSVLKKL